MFEKLLEKLRELFQLNQPELDFGIYRIMHAKAHEITKFLEQDLLPQVKEALSAYQSGARARLERELDEATEQAKNLGVNPDEVAKVKDIKAQLEDLPNGETAEAEVYEALYKFFRRYYSQGDFLSRRVYKKDVYAIPYEGEEVMLHWANRDQYYIKSSETLREYAFRLRPDDTSNPMRVHFRVIGADEEEHNTTKVAEGKQRVFRLAENRPPVIEDGELHIFFRYEQADKKQIELSLKTADWFKSSAPKDLADWKTELLRAAPTKANESRTLIEKHLERYTSRNTFDYFIHKDLGGFLRRELDFFIKNEIMNLDDIEDATAAKADQYLAKIKAIRIVAGKIITFLAELEDFQKKLWLKKKFVVRADYLISPTVLPDESLENVLGNKQQIADWESLGLVAKNSRLTAANLRSLTGLLVDTRFFPSDERDIMLAALENLEDLTVGWLFAGDNFQSMNAMKTTFAGRIGFVYADPPYNTGGDFIYKDSYQHSTWLTMMDNRLRLVWDLLAYEGRFFCSIDDRENDNLLKLLNQVWSGGSYLGAITWEKRTKPQNTESAAKMLQSKVEYIHPFVKTESRQEFHRESVAEKQYPENDKVGPYRVERLEEMSAEDVRARATMVFEILGVSPRPGKQWKVGQEYVSRKLAAGDIFLKDGWPCRKVRPDEEDGSRYRPFWSHFFEKEVYGTAEEGLSLVDKDLGFGKAFQTVKPLRLLEKLVFHAAEDGSVVLDPFAGSGTTAHAVLSTARSQGRDMRFIMCEAGSWFETLLVPRVKKVMFATDWKNGQPSDSGILTSEQKPKIVRIVHLEQYEDTLNNLDIKRPAGVEELFSGGDRSLREEYVLRYMLNVETRGSASLLNASAFTDPRKYTLRVKSPGSDETVETAVDLLETFNWLLGLRVRHIAASETFSATFNDNGKRLRATLKSAKNGAHWFRPVSGTLPDGREALIVWRTLTDDAARDEAALLEWFSKKGFLNSESLDVVYVNGDCNLAASKPGAAKWTIEPLEARFHELMFEGQRSDAS